MFGCYIRFARRTHSKCEHAAGGQSDKGISWHSKINNNNRNDCELWATTRNYKQMHHNLYWGCFSQQHFRKNIIKNGWRRLMALFHCIIPTMIDSSVVFVYELTEKEWEANFCRLILCFCTTTNAFFLWPPHNDYSKWKISIRREINFLYFVYQSNENQWTQLNGKNRWCLLHWFLGKIFSFHCTQKITGFSQYKFRCLVLFVCVTQRYAYKFSTVTKVSCERGKKM